MVVVGKKEGLGEGRETRRPFGVLGSEFQILKKDRRVFCMTRISGGIGHKDFLDEGCEDDAGEDGVNGEDIGEDNCPDVR
jgi:hypothetical protein